MNALVPFYVFNLAACIEAGLGALLKNKLASPALHGPDKCSCFAFSSAQTSLLYSIYFYNSKNNCKTQRVQERVMNRRKCIPALLILVRSVILIAAPLSNGIPPLFKWSISESLNLKYSWLKISKKSIYQLVTFERACLYIMTHCSTIIHGSKKRSQLCTKPLEPTNKNAQRGS